MKKKIIWAVVAVLVILAAVPVILGSKKSKVTYLTVPVETRDIYKTVSATGALEPVNKVDVGTQVSGIIDKIYVDFNSVVTKGQLLAEMDRTTLIAEVNSAKASLNSAQIEMDYQSKNYERYSRLHEKGLVSDTDYEQAVYNYDRARESLEIQKSTMSRTNRNLEYATITSPVDGVVLDRAVDEGQTVAAGFSTPTLFTIAADLKDMQVIADVDEADIGYVQEGQRVSFTVDAFPDETFDGSVAQVRLNPQTESNVTTYEVVVSAPNPDQTLKPGMTANITIYTLSEENTLSVPMKALRYNPDPLPDGYAVPTGKHDGTLWTFENGVMNDHVVTVGINDGTYAAVFSDQIREGMQVVTGEAAATKKGLLPGPPDDGPGPGEGGPGPGGPGM